MPLENCKISFFKVQRCGYFKGHSTSEAFGSISATLGQMAVWSQGKQLAQTQTYQNVIKPNGDVELPAYLYDIKRSRDEWLLLVWNQVPATNNQVASVMANSQVGQAVVHMNSIAPGSIPGFATYFWFLPDLGVFANIRFQHAAGGHSALQSYFKGFLERCSSHVVINPGATGSLFDLQIDGYRRSLSDPVTQLSPRFRSCVFTKPGDHEFLIQNAPKIRKILRKTKLELQTPEDLQLWQQMWRKIRPEHTTQQTDPLSIQYEMKASLTSQEIAEIIATQTSQTGVNESWDDIGFVLAGENTPRWLSKSYARDDFDLNFTRENLEIVNLESLLAALNQRRTAILSLLS